MADEIKPVETPLEVTPVEGDEPNPQDDQGKNEAKYTQADFDRGVSKALGTYEANQEKKRADAKAAQEAQEAQEAAKKDTDKAPAWAKALIDRMDGFEAKGAEQSLAESAKEAGIPQKFHKYLTSQTDIDAFVTDTPALLDKANVGNDLYPKKATNTQPEKLSADELEGMKKMKNPKTNLPYTPDEWRAAKAKLPS